MGPIYGQDISQWAESMLWVLTPQELTISLDPSSDWVFLPPQPVPHNWHLTGHAMWYPACGKMQIKDPLLLVGKCGEFPLSKKPPQITTFISLFD